MVLASGNFHFGSGSSSIVLEAHLQTDASGADLPGVSVRVSKLGAVCVEKLAHNTFYYEEVEALQGVEKKRVSVDARNVDKPPATVSLVILEELGDHPSADDKDIDVSPKALHEDWMDMCDELAQFGLHHGDICLEHILKAP
ncbi:hypothetical protein EIP91_002015 [Steccherinum ochraceum]|uniref:Uncharacterized protein n=1 Tax=Steccherinum ochraceum TaxID=92696 RepID=A0A4R0RCT7_9APHY|nr:hypothetical protein EIP91_002015 [Steccherinum ochraceum]